MRYLSLVCVFYGVSLCCLKSLHNMGSSMENNNFSHATLCVQGGYTPQAGQSRIAPVVQSTTYRYDDIWHLQRVMTLQATGYKYSRTGNPTVTAFEESVRLLEGGAAAVATASGQAANLLALVNICRNGDHILAASTLYGGSFSLLNTTLPKFGITTTFFDPEAPLEDIAKLVQPRTRLIFAETIGNPGLNILDFDKIRALSQEYDLPVVIDNTLASPVLCNPLQLGAHIVTHSASKYIDGHGTSVGGIVVDGGNYNWDNGRYPDFTQPDPSYAGVSYTEKFPQAPFTYKARAHILRDFGACLAPQNAFLFNVGIDTLQLRMERHGNNARKLAAFLQNHPQVAWVRYPGLDEVGKERIARYFRADNGSGVLTFGVRGGLETIDRFVRHLQLATLVVHVGDARTSVLHPASTTHAQLSEEQLRAAGVLPEMVRISVGIEDADDIINDIAQALERSK